MSDYNRTIGYADLSAIDSVKAKGTVTYGKKIIYEKFPDLKINSIFIAGCGDGTEAILLQKVFDKYVYGIDISLEKEVNEPGKITLKNGDLMNLTLPENSFDFIYSYHVLEHVPDPYIVMQSLSKMLKDEGLVFIGFPNRNRLIGYLGTHNNVSMMEKIKWNIKDYKDRFKGRFENKYGAHAGFTNSEFIKLAKSFYKTVIPVRNEYMLLKYAKYKFLIRVLINLGLSEFLFPSNYYILKK